MDLSLYLRLRRDQLPSSGLAEVSLFLSYILFSSFPFFPFFLLFDGEFCHVGVSQRDDRSFSCNVEYFRVEIIIEGFFISDEKEYIKSSLLVCEQKL